MKKKMLMQFAAVAQEKYFQHFHILSHRVI